MLAEISLLVFQSNRYCPSLFRSIEVLFAGFFLIFLCKSSFVRISHSLKRIKINWVSNNIGLILVKAGQDKLLRRIEISTVIWYWWTDCIEAHSSTWYQIPEDWRYQEARRLFKEPLVYPGNKEPELKWNSPDEEVPNDSVDQGGK